MFTHRYAPTSAQIFTHGMLHIFTHHMCILRNPGWVKGAGDSGGQSLYPGLHPCGAYGTNVLILSRSSPASFVKLIDQIELYDIYTPRTVSTEPVDEMPAQPTPAISPRRANSPDPDAVPLPAFAHALYAPRSTSTCSVGGVKTRTPHLGSEVTSVMRQSVQGTRCHADARWRSADACPAAPSRAAWPTRRRIAKSARLEEAIVITRLHDEIAGSLCNEVACSGETGYGQVVRPIPESAYTGSINTEDPARLTAKGSGVHFATASMLCITPPRAVEPQIGRFDPGVSRPEKYTAHSSSPSTSLGTSGSGHDSAAMAHLNDSCDRDLAPWYCLRCGSSGLTLQDPVRPRYCLVCAAKNPLLMNSHRYSGSHIFAGSTFRVEYHRGGTDPRHVEQWSLGKWTKHLTVRPPELLEFMPSDSEWRPYSRERTPQSKSCSETAFEIPTVDLKSDSRVFALLAEGRETSRHGKDWIERAAKALELAGAHRLVSDLDVFQAR